MDQTPVHERHNADLLHLMPPSALRVVEVGCSSGALAREYKKINAACAYLGVEIAAEYAQLARRHCDAVLEVDIESLTEQAVRGLEADCWVFGDSLEHLRDPWALLRRVRAAIPGDGHVVACIPNAQHWSVQARLACGELRYEDMGLLDRTHLRWFTRITILDMFQQSGFRVVVMNARVFNEPQREKVLAAIEAMARTLGANPAQAMADASVFQYVLRAVPA